MARVIANDSIREKYNEEGSRLNDRCLFICVTYFAFLPSSRCSAFFRQFIKRHIFFEKLLNNSKTCLPFTLNIYPVVIVSRVRLNVLLGGRINSPSTTIERKEIQHLKLH